VAVPVLRKNISLGLEPGIVLRNLEDEASTAKGLVQFCGFPPTPEFKGDLEEMSLLAGESVGQTKRLMSAASIIEEMISGARSRDQESTWIDSR
jgi:hypothetical protein